MTATLKCLLVDDREENLVALEALLKQPDLELLTARSGSDALALLARHDFSLAIIDVRMPDMDGFQLAEFMRDTERTRHVPIILVTAAATGSRMFKGYEAGAVDFLSKPIDPLQLQSKTQTFFRLGRKRQQLQEALRVNELLMAVLGHDLRNPLNTLVAALDVLTPEARPDQVKTLKTMKDTVGRMGGLISELLDFVRAQEVGGIPVVLRPIELGSVVQRVLNEHHLAHRDSTITVKLVGDAFRGRWDENRLCQVLSNLLENAVRHGAPDSPVELILDGTRSDAVLLTVRNAGTIDPEARAHLFEPYYGLKRQRKGGLGLGLHIVQQIVKGHGGSVQLVCSESHTTFNVTLPRGLLASPEEHPTRHAAAVEASPLL